MTGKTGVMAIDPGMNGAYAVFRADGELHTADDLPRFETGLDGSAIAALFKRFRPSLVMIERENARPGEGVSSMFKFGFACGLVAGVAHSSEAPIHYVSPNVWKKHFKLLGKPKDSSRELASRLYPSYGGLLRKKDHNRAEAILLGHYTLDTIHHAKIAPETEPALEDENEEDLVI